MVASFLLLLEHLFGPALVPWAWAAHIAALVVLTVSWAGPVVKFFQHRRPAPVRPGPHTWTCPRCGKVLPAAQLACDACVPAKGWQNAPWMASLRRTARIAGFTAQVGYAVVYFTSTFLMAYRFRLFSFDHRPLEQFLAAATLLLWTACLHYFRRVWAAGGGFVTRLQDLGASAAFALLFLSVGSLWAAAPFAGGQALAALSVTPDGVMRLANRPDRRVPLAMDPSDGNVIVAAQYARVTWPILMVDQTIVLRIGTEAVSRRGTRRLMVILSNRLSVDEPYRPRFTVSTQVLRLLPPGNYEIRRAQTGEGLVARPAVPGA